MFRTVRLLILALLVVAQLSIFVAPAVAGPEDKIPTGCLVWVWIDGWRCAVP